MNRQKAWVDQELGLASKMVKNALQLVLALCLIAGVEAYSQDYSFKVKYGMIQAGSAKLSYHNEDSVLRGNLNIKSSSWLSALWTLADSIESIYNLETNRLQHHTKAIHEGSFHRNYEVVFGDSDEVIINGKSKSIKIQGLKDVPSLIYELSQTHFTHGDTLNYPLWDGRGYGMLSLVVEKVQGPSLFKPFSVLGWRLTPLSSTRKSRENRIQLSLLLSESFPHTPDRIEIDTKYGAVVMRLEKH